MDRSGDDAELRDMLRATRVGRHRKVEPSELEAGVVVLRVWQSNRLAETHADLLSDERYAKACRFFLTDIYAPRDFSQRDHDITRMYNSMHAVLPPLMRRSLELVLELNALTTELENRLVEVLLTECRMRDRLTVAMYAQAYRLSDNYADRVRQIELIVEVGREVDALVHKPFVGAALKLARLPARIAGWHEMQDFFERGFEAFHHMRGAGEFLDRIASRERELLDQIYAGDDAPFPDPQLAET